MIVFYAASLIMTACAPAVQPIVEQPSSPTQTQEQSGESLIAPVITGTISTARPDPIQTPVQRCAGGKGVISRSYIISKALPGRLYYTVYLPPCYSDDIQYPVLYLLHGKTYQDDQWIKLGLPELMDAGVLDGSLPPFIVVMPYDPGWPDPADGNYDKAIAEELVPWIEKEYSASTNRNDRAIGGISRGSGWAFHTVMRYPNLFAILGIHSPSFFRTDRRTAGDQIALLAQKKPVRFILDAGDQDPEYNYAIKLEGYLTEFGIDHSWSASPGTHSEAYWRKNLPDYLREYSKNW